MDTTYAAEKENLEKVFGPASASGFGSAVFSEAATPLISLDSVALKHCKAFLGVKLTPQTEAIWMNEWRRVYVRGRESKAGIQNELLSIADPDAKRSVPLLTELIEDADRARLALSGAFDHPDVQELAVYKLGDGEAMSGIMISARYKAEVIISVVALMD
jgi:hypothetical protein